MSSSVRWRVMVLQAVALFALAFGAGFALWVSSFTHDTIRDQLTAQKIFFPPAGSAALSPSEFPDLKQYAGQQVDTGDKAKAYANGFIGRHLTKIANSQTYSDGIPPSRQEHMPTERTDSSPGAPTTAFLVRQYGTTGPAHEIVGYAYESLRRAELHVSWRTGRNE